MTGRDLANDPCSSKKQRTPKTSERTLEAKEKPEGESQEVPYVGRGMLPENTARKPQGVGFALSSP